MVCRSPQQDAELRFDTHYHSNDSTSIIIVHEFFVPFTSAHSRY
jgi:hypothetical protein